ncbi:Transducin/WD40 repeat-like superfamily protein [Perilla frutescens var. frutescens]|nr:Transducin/WD40 repeat-like superfamily protein [Perilla frutescens var. frutescens]
MRTREREENPPAEVKARERSRLLANTTTITTAPKAHNAREALKRLAAASFVKGALQGLEIRGLILRLANHGELTQLSNLVNNFISVGLGRESAFAAALLGDNILMEKAWQETGILTEVVLHAYAHGRPTLRSLVQAWNKTLQKELENTRSTKMDAATLFLANRWPGWSQLILLIRGRPVWS